jgi:Lysyl oxidase
MPMTTRSALGLLALGILGFAFSAPATAGAPPNPCEGAEAEQLLCPNLKIGRAADIYLDPSGGRLLLRATSDVKSRGRGPIELRGRRNGWRTMRVRQRIYRAGGGYVDVATRATLRFTDVGDYFGGGFWKVHQLARFELRRVGPREQVGRVIRSGPKLNYCLRDLERTKSGRHSPTHRHYPGCDQNPYRNAVTLGTSVGWSDIYPADYDKQWIPVGGLRGCFVFVMTVDPRQLLYESNERDNTSRRRIRLPYPGHSGC